MAVDPKPETPKRGKKKVNQMSKDVVTQITGDARLHDCTRRKVVSLETLSLVLTSGISDIQTAEEQSAATGKTHKRFLLSLNSGGTVKLRKSQFSRLIQPIALDPNAEHRTVATLRPRAKQATETYIREKRRMARVMRPLLAPIMEKLDRLANTPVGA